MSDEASLVIIKRSGADGPHFPLRRKEYLFGSDVNCDLRVQIPGVAMEHAKIIRTMNGNEFDLQNLTDKEILVNGKAFKETVHLHNMDVFSIENRSFRFECGESKEILKSKSTKKIRKSTGILQETNKCNEPSGVKDSPYTPRPRRPSLRESLGQLRRQSVQFKEEGESSSFKSFEANENHQVPTVPPKKVPSACSTPQRNIKRVSFGPVLSPEQFIKELPVITPVRKGATPRRLSVPHAKSCLSPARRRYSVAATSFVSKIEEEDESDSGDESSDETSVDETSSSDESTVISSPESPKSKRKRLATPVRKEIEQGTKLRQRTKKVATPLKNAIKAGFRLKATKKKLQAPLKREIEAGLWLRQTKKKLATPIRQAIKGKPKLRATRNRMVTPVRKEIEAKRSLRPTKKVMCTELQEEIRNGVTLRETKKVMPKELQEKIKAGRTLRKIKRSMKPELREEIAKGKEQLRNTKKKMATPVRAEIAKGVKLRVTRKRMPSILQDEINRGTIELRKTKKSLKTPLRKEIEKGARLRSTKTKGVETSSKTPKRRHSAVDESNQSSQVVTKKLKTPNKTPRQGAFHPITKSRQRSIGRSRRKSTKPPPSYAEILKRPKLMAKRRLTDRRTSVYQFQAEQEVANKTKAKSSTTTATVKVPKSKSKSPARRKSQAKLASKKTDEKKAEDEWQVVLNKRKIMRIKRHRAVKSQQEKVEDDFSGVDVLFKTPKPVRVQPMKKDTPKEVETCATTLSPLGRKSLGLTGVRELVKTPKEGPEVRLNGIRELMKTPKEGPEVRLNGIRELMKTPKEGPEVRLNGLRELMKTPRDAQGIASPNYVGVKRMFSTPKERGGCSDDTVLHGVARLMEEQQVNYEGVAELFEVLEMASPLTATRTPSLRKTADKMTVVTPMVPSCTPSLRRRCDKNEVVAPLHSANTPSLRRRSDKNEVVAPLHSANTPSLRRRSDKNEVVAPLHSANTPSLRRRSDKNEVVAPLHSANTPSLRNAKDDVVVMTSPVLEMTSPAHAASSLNKASEEVEIVAEEVEKFAEVFEKVDEEFEKVDEEFEKVHEEFEKVHEEFEKVDEEFEKVTQEVALLFSAANENVLEDVAVPSPETAPEATSGRKSTRSKRKAEQPSQPPAVKRQRRAKAQETAYEKVATTKAEQQKTEPPKRSSRSRTKPEHETESDDVVEMPSSSTARQAKPRGKRAAPSDFEEPSAKSRKLPPEPVVVKTTRTRRGQASKPSNAAVVVETNTRTSRSTRGKKKETKPSEAPIPPVAATPKIPVSSRKSANVPGIPETPQPLIITRTKLETIIEVPTPASSVRGRAAQPRFTAVGSRGRSGKSATSKNGEATKALETVVETETACKVPTRSTRSCRGKASVKVETVVKASEAPAKTESVHVPLKNSRSKRNLMEEPVVQESVLQEPVVQEPVVQEPVVQESVVQEPVVQEPVITIPKRSRRTKPAVSSIKEEEKVDEHTLGVRGKRSATRARNNNQKESEVVVKEESRTRGRKVVVGKESVEEQSSRAVRITRPKRGAVVEHAEKAEGAEVEKEVEKVEVTIEDEVKRPRRGRKVEETKTSSEDCEDGGKPKRGATRSTAKRTAKKDETSSKTQKKQNTKIQEKATASPVATRVTRSRRNK